ncbi:MFS transporter [Sneathiella sp. HT1-7]|uniref:MFS transporter n=1 Tax=Sneathiella sp. HT1-7 TaxID=2887192 RepID=UPI001D14E67F|nr:MFS transporter [Sneathiella sp. HT1-7]MCC3303182.1 MFS transporter [Sneathiella sp. HT1-7]
MNNKALFTLYFVVMLDVAGQGILFPALTTLIINPTSHFLPEGTTASTRNFYYGLITGSFFFCWFLGATMIASYSDDVGRKIALVICLIGSALGYILTIIGIYLQSISLLVLGRIIAGFTAGSQSVSQAAIIDISTDENRTENLGRLVAALAAGLAFGPIVGGVFSDKTLWPELNVTVPVYIITACLLLNLILVLKYFKDVRETDGNFTFNIFSAFTELAAAAKTQAIRNISIVFFICVFSLTLFYIYSIVYLFRKFAFTTIENSAAMFVIGIGLAVGSRYLIKPLADRFTQDKIVSGSLLTMALFQGIFLLSGNEYIAVASMLPLLMAYGVAYTNCLSIFSDAVSEDKQGWVMGISISLFTFGGGVVSIAGEELMNIFLELPFLLSIIGMVIASALAVGLKILQPYKIPA